LSLESATKRDQEIVFRDYALHKAQNRVILTMGYFFLRPGLLAMIRFTSSVLIWNMARTA
jgi:hypothetical protein